MADISSQQIERHQVNDSWGRYTAERLQKAIPKKKIHVGDLSYSIIYSLISQNGDTTSIRHTFNYYGKFVDMGVSKGHPIGDQRSNADVYALIGGGRKPKKWFSKTYYGQVAALRDLQMKKYQEQAVGIIKEEISKIYR